MTNSDGAKAWEERKKARNRINEIKREIASLTEKKEKFLSGRADHWRSAMTTNTIDDQVAKLQEEMATRAS